MTWKECLQNHKNALANQFGEREANAMLRIISEDYIPQLNIGLGDPLGSTEVFSIEHVVTSILQGEKDCP